MHVKAKSMAFGSLLLAVSVVCMSLGSVIDVYKRQAYYSGLCHILKEKYGISGQMTLTYDMKMCIRDRFLSAAANWLLRCFCI